MEFAGIPLGAVVSPTIIKACQVNIQSTKGRGEDLVLVPVHSTEADTAPQDRMGQMLRIHFTLHDVQSI